MVRGTRGSAPLAPATPAIAPSNLLKVPDRTREPTQLGGSCVLLDLQPGVGWCVWRPLGLAEDSDGKGDPKLS